MCEAPVGYIDSVVKQIVSELFEKYMNEMKDDRIEDDDYLTKDQTRKFVTDVLEQFDTGLTFAEDDFDKYFAEVDNDGSDQIEKDELAHFIKKVAGLDHLEEELKKQKKKEGDNLFNV